MRVSLQISVYDREIDQMNFCSMQQGHQKKRLQYECSCLQHAGLKLFFYGTTDLISRELNPPSGNDIGIMTGKLRGIIDLRTFDNQHSRTNIRGPTFDPRTNIRCAVKTEIESSGKSLKRVITQEIRRRKTKSCFATLHSGWKVHEIGA